MTRLGVGRSTVPEAVALLGEPGHRSQGDHGSTVLTWQSSTHSHVGGGSVTTMRLTFGQEGRLSSTACDTVLYPPLIQEPAGR